MRFVRSHKQMHEELYGAFSAELLISVCLRDDWSSLSQELAISSLNSESVPGVRAYITYFIYKFAVYDGQFNVLETSAEIDYKARLYKTSKMGQSHVTFTF